MKRMIWCAGIILLISGSVQSQTRTQKGQKVPSKKASKNKSLSQPPGMITLNTTAAYPAKAKSSLLTIPETTFTISDPVLTTLSARANGANIKFNKSGIVGMPKRAYGFADGHISLATTGAVTSGTQTGSGLVGTGTSLATFGSIGAPMNVNGKSPYAGMNMWGNALNLAIRPPADSSVRLAPAKKQ